MKLKEWIDEEVERTGESRTEIMKRLRRVSGVSVTTLGSLDRGAALTRGDKAQALVSATHGRVTLEDLL